MAKKDEKDEKEPEVKEISDLDSEVAALELEEAKKRATAAPVIVLTPAEQRQNYLKIITAYKKQNPIKYGIKKDAFEKKLASFN